MSVRLKNIPKKACTGLIFIYLVVFPNITLGISFGAYVKNDIINLQPGGHGNFEILFYSRSGEASQFHMLTKQSPEDFIVTYPESFDLDSKFLKDEYVLMSGEYVKGKIVKVSVNVPDDADNGEHIILIDAITSDKDTEGLLNVNAEKTFLLKVNVEGQIGREDDNREVSIVDNIITEGEETKIESEVSTKATSDNKNLLLLFTLTVIFAVIIYIIYKKTRGPKYISFKSEYSSNNGD